LQKVLILIKEKKIKSGKYRNLFKPNFYKKLAKKRNPAQLFFYSYLAKQRNILPPKFILTAAKI